MSQPGLIIKINSELEFIFTRRPSPFFVTKPFQISDFLEEQNTKYSGLVSNAQHSLCLVN